MLAVTTPARFVWGIVSGLAFVGTYQLFRWRKRKYASGETKGP